MFVPSCSPGGRRAWAKSKKARDPRRALTGLLRYLAPFKAGLTLVLGCVLVYTLLGLAGPYLMGVAIDRFIAAKRPDGLARIALLMLTVYVLNNLFQALAAWIMSNISQRALQSMRQDMFRHVQTLPQSFFDQRPAGELMSRLTNDIDAINQAVSQNVTSLIASVLSMGGILIAMFILDRWLALAALLVVPIMFWFTVMEEAISGQKVIKAFRRNQSAVAAFRRHNRQVFRAGVSANSYAMLLMPLTNVLGNLFVIVIAGLGGWLALQGLVSVGVIATFISYGQNFINPLRQLANMYNSIQAALAGAERVFEIMDTPSKVDDAPSDGSEAVSLDSMQGHVRFEHVCFGYQPDLPVIKDMTLEAKPEKSLPWSGRPGPARRRSSTC